MNYKALFIILFLVSQNVKAHTYCIRHLKDLRITSVLKENNFITKRDLNEYREMFHDLKTELKALNKEDHWIDLGAGSGFAILDYYRKLKGHAQATGIVYQRPETVAYLEHIKSARYLEGRFFEDIPNFEIGKANIITDFFGVLSYTRDLRSDLNKALELLKPKGILYIYYGVMGHKSKTTIKYGNSEIDLKTYLELVPGLEVIAMPRKVFYNNGRSKVDDASIVAYKIIRHRNYVEGSLPKLDLEFFYNDAPPRRVFNLHQP